MLNKFILYFILVFSLHAPSNQVFAPQKTGFSIKKKVHRAARVSRAYVDYLIRNYGILIPITVVLAAAVLSYPTLTAKKTEEQIAGANKEAREKAIEEFADFLKQKLNATNSQSRKDELLAKLFSLQLLDEKGKSSPLSYYLNDFYKANHFVITPNLEQSTKDLLNLLPKKSLINYNESYTAEDYSTHDRLLEILKKQTGQTKFFAGSLDKILKAVYQRITFSDQVVAQNEVAEDRYVKNRVDEIMQSWTQLHSITEGVLASDEYAQKCRLLAEIVYENTGFNFALIRAAYSTASPTDVETATVQATKKIKKSIVIPGTLDLNQDRINFSEVSFKQDFEPNARNNFRRKVYSLEMFGEAQKLTYHDFMSQYFGNITTDTVKELNAQQCNTHKESINDFLTQKWQENRTENNEEKLKAFVAQYYPAFDLLAALTARISECSHATYGALGS